MGGGTKVTLPFETRPFGIHVAPAKSGVLFFTSSSGAVIQKIEAEEKFDWLKKAGLKVGSRIVEIKQPNCDAVDVEKDYYANILKLMKNSDLPINVTFTTLGDNLRQSSFVKEFGEK